MNYIQEKSGLQPKMNLNWLIVNGNIRSRKIFKAMNRVVCLPCLAVPVVG